MRADDDRIPLEMTYEPKPVPTRIQYRKMIPRQYRFSNLVSTLLTNKKKP
ncbi:hypothetical protein CLV58_109153 [Spirosoma oryzae]|uniref:Uncharacterized protein n=1 Tax=Spirosoma oryzae TaxID=1469603 RepID=A0A2T0SYD8_9BACT|nr:hypothetical protein [Spirosoma oryzae]PRY38426.1 hypothetical protein CLV58_109153 [Spirosoma oryzae]